MANPDTPGNRRLPATQDECAPRIRIERTRTTNSGFFSSWTASAGTLRVSESGIHDGRDIARLRAAGYQAFLVGEHLMKAEDPAEALARLVAV